MLDRGLSATPFIIVDYPQSITYYKTYYTDFFKYQFLNNPKLII